MTKEIYWLDYGKQKVTKKEATANGCYVYEMVDLTTTNKTLGCSVTKDKEKADV